jgi:tetratricopeptide (TPR) repeat protein
VRAIRTSGVCCSIICVLLGVAFAQQTPDFESLLASAQQAQVRSDFQTAAEFYRQAVDLHPEIAELQANLGLMYYQTGNDQQAAEAFRKAIRLKPALFVPNLFLGLDYLKSKRFKEAIPYLKRATLSRASDIQAELGLGQAYAAVGDTRRATRAYMRATELDPANADAWYRLGIGYLEQVEADARIALTRHKDSGYSQALMADNFSQQRAFIQAEAAYEKVLALSTHPPGLHAEYALALLNRHDLPAAERELKAELGSSPGSLTAKLGLARLQVEQGEAGRGVEEITKIWNTDAGFLRANAPRLTADLSQARRSELERALQDRQAAGDVSQEVVALFRNESARGGDCRCAIANPDLPTAPANAPRPDAAKLYAEGRYRQCVQLLASRLSLLPVKDLRLLASCGYSTGDYRDASDAGAKLAASATTEAEGLYWEIRSAQKLASDALARASELDSGSPKLHVLLGDVYRQRSDLPGAEKEYRKALELQPEDTGALFGLSLVLLADQEKDEALRLAQTALQKNADDPELNAVMGEILCARYDYSGAEPYLNKSLKAKPEYVSHVHALLGKVYAQTNRTQDAIAQLKLALADDKDGQLHYQIARLYLKVGDRESAEQALHVSERLRSEGLNRATVAIQQGQDNSDSQ